MEKKLKVLMIGAHPDDNDICGGGLALKYAKAGHSVRFLSVCNGCGGHHKMQPKEIAERRYGETQAVAAFAGIEYDVWNIPDCEVIADLETRKKLITYIRKFNPDIIFSHRTNDYHADHRNVAMLVQDASYLLTVPNLYPEEPAMRFMPVIMYFRDHFKNPPFVPDIVIDIDDVIDDKFRLWNGFPTPMELKTRFPKAQRSVLAGFTSPQCREISPSLTLLLNAWTDTSLTEKQRKQSTRQCTALCS